MSKDIYWQNRIYIGVQDGESRYNYPNHEVLNAPVDWIDGKEVSGLYEFAPSHPDNKVIYVRAIKASSGDTKKQETVYGECGKHPGNNLVNCGVCQMEKNTATITYPYNVPPSGEKEEQEVKEDEKSKYVDSLIDSIKVDKANFQYIASSGRINGSLWVSLRALLYKILPQ